MLSFWVGQTVATTRRDCLFPEVSKYPLYHFPSTVYCFSDMITTKRPRIETGLAAGTSARRSISGSPFEGIPEGYTPREVGVADTRNGLGGVVHESLAQADGSSSTRAGFYDEINEIETQEHDSGQNSDDSMSSPCHLYTPEVSYCNLYFFHDNTTRKKNSSNRIRTPLRQGRLIQMKNLQRT